MKKWNEIKEKLLKNAEFQDEVNNLQPEYELIKQIIQARIEQSLTQEELAQRIGTKQSNISRLEKGKYNPSLLFLKKLAQGLGKDLRISFVDGCM